MQEKGFSIKSIVKGANLSLIVSLISILIFAFIIKMAGLNNGVIKCVNQFIKIISIFLGCAFFVKGGMGLVKGLLLGVIFFLLITLIFSLFGGGLAIDLGFILDLLFCAVVGAISGVISVNVNR